MTTVSSKGGRVQLGLTLILMIDAQSLHLDHSTVIVSLQLMETSATRIARLM